MKPLKYLNLGCDGDYKESNDFVEWVNLDVDESNNPDIVFDLNNPFLPFDDDEFDYILASHIFEHLTCDFHQLFKDLHRILKPNGTLEIFTPHFSHSGSAGMYHTRQFNCREFYIVPKFTLEKIRLNILTRNTKKEKKKRNKGFPYKSKIRKKKE